MRIRPIAVISSSEPLTEETRSAVRLAWGVDVFDVYPATETAGLGCECSEHRGLHMFEDLVITEVVDDEQRPVPAGVLGAKILVTVLFSRTQPLIRYEMSDRVQLSEEHCPCGRPFRLITQIAGRQEDTLHLPARGTSGSVPVHPVVFHKILDRLDVAGWQIRQEAQRLLLLLAGGPADLDINGVKAVVVGSLERAGVDVPVVVERVDAVPKTIAGKSPAIVPLAMMPANKQG